MHLLWKKNTEPRTQQLRFKRLALHQSRLPAKLRYRSDLSGRNQSPNPIEEPDFYRLVFVDGKTIREACDILGISMSAGDNWYRKYAGCPEAD